MAPKLGSVVIPAYNEAAVIGRCLDQLFDGLDPAEVDVVVACNGCTDATAEVARSTGYPVTVLDLPEPGKVAALRAAERATTALPRIFLDADIEVRGDAVRQVLLALGADAVAARPPVRFETSASTWAVRRFYAVRRRLPGIEADLCAAGMYGLSALARSRFDEFPDVVGDDLFAARVVEPSEIVVVDVEPAVIHVPRDTGSLLKVLKRVYRGNREFSESHPDLARPTTSSTFRDIARSVGGPRDAVDAVVYVALVVWARVLLRLERRSSRWERDDSSRAASSTVPR